jgi:hypothetical protein
VLLFSVTLEKKKKKKKKKRVKNSNLMGNQYILKILGLKKKGMLEVLLVFSSGIHLE